MSPLRRLPVTASPPAINLALLVTADDGGERGCQVGERIDGVKLAGLDERGDGRLNSLPPCHAVSVRRMHFLRLRGAV